MSAPKSGTRDGGCLLHAACRCAPHTTCKQHGASTHTRARVRNKHTWLASSLSELCAACAARVCRCSPAAAAACCCCCRCCCRCCCCSCSRSQRGGCACMGACACRACVRACQGRVGCRPTQSIRARRLAHTDTGGRDCCCCCRRPARTQARSAPGAVLKVWQRRFQPSQVRDQHVKRIRAVRGVRLAPRGAPDAAHGGVHGGAVVVLL
jgi:hypothetical protein